MLISRGAERHTDEVPIMTAGLRRASNRVIAIGILAAVNWFSAGTAGAQRSQDNSSQNAASQDRTWCENRQRAFAPDLRINGCTALIESGNLTRSDLAISHNNRGTAYQEMHDYD